MLKQNVLQKDYTVNQELPINLDYMISVYDSVRLLSEFVDEMDFVDLYSTYSPVREIKYLQE